MCDGACGAIAVALAVILIVKANKNRISYGNSIELNFLLTGLNSLLKNVVNNVCLWPFHLRTCECICLWLYFQSVRLSILSHRNSGSAFTPLNKYSDTKKRAGSHIWSWWLLWHQYKRGPYLHSTISRRLEWGHNSHTSQNMQYVNDMCKCNACERSCKRIGRICWSLKQGSMWFPRALWE